MYCLTVFSFVTLLMARTVSLGDALQCVICNNCQLGEDIRTVTCQPPASNSCVKSVQQRFNEFEYRIFRKCSTRKLENDYLVECDGDPDVGKQCVHYCASDECNSVDALSSCRVFVCVVAAISLLNIFAQ